VPVFDFLPSLDEVEGLASPPTGAQRERTMFRISRVRQEAIIDVDRVEQFELAIRSSERGGNQAVMP
jgi:hypothetical protein